MCETKCIIIPKLDSKNFYTLIYILSSFIRNLLPKYILPNYILPKLVEDQAKKNTSVVVSYFDIVSTFVSDFLAGIIILKNRNTKEKLTSSMTMSSEGEKTLKKMKKLFYLLIPFITLLHFCGQFLFYFYHGFYSEININNYITEESLFFVIFFDILFRYIFSRVFLDSYFYKHHYVSMLLNTVGFIPLLIISLKNIFENDNKEIVLVYLILYLIRVIIFSLEDVFIKITLNKLLLRPYELMFYKSLFELIPITIVTIISFSKYLDDIQDISSNIIYFLVYRIVYILCYFFSDLSLITIIELISPNHLSILKSIEFVILFINNTIWNIFQKKNEKNDAIINYSFEFISFLILLFAACLHNEMIIIKRCGLYECTDYYKSEVKGFSNIDVNFDDDKSNRSSTIRNNKSEIKGELLDHDKNEGNEVNDGNEGNDVFSINNEEE